MIGTARSAISRINPATGLIVWTSSVPTATICPLSASATYVVSGATILSTANGATVHELSAESEGWAFGNDILVQDGSVLMLDTLQKGRLQALWHRNIRGFDVLLELPQIVLTPQNPSGSLARADLVNPANGAIAESIKAVNVVPTQRGLDALAPTGQLIFVSLSGVKTGPKSRGFDYYSGGILWSYLSPNGYSAGPVYAHAMAADSFKPLGRLVTTRAQVSAEGNDSFVVSDGQYAAIVAVPVIYIFKL